MPRFVILEHDWPCLHWDLMLEDGDVLRTWRLHLSPDAGMTIAAEALPDHRLAYLEYEGPVSGDRGTVNQWDAGEFEWVVDAAERCAVELRGNVIAGSAVLLKTAGERWEFSVG